MEPSVTCLPKHDTYSELHELSLRVPAWATVHIWNCMELRPHAARPPPYGALALASCVNHTPTFFPAATLFNGSEHALARNRCNHRFAGVVDILLPAEGRRLLEPCSLSCAQNMWDCCTSIGMPNKSHSAFQ